MKAVTPDTLRQQIEEAREKKAQVTADIDLHTRFHEEREEEILRQHPEVWKEIREHRQRHRDFMVVLHGQRSEHAGRIAALEDLLSMLEQDDGNDGDDAPEAEAGDVSVPIPVPDWEWDDEADDEGPVDLVTEAEALAQRVEDGVATDAEVRRLKALKSVIDAGIG